MGNHALLSASSSHRWLNCPPSARLGENYEDKGSDFAAEGTDAHSLCEHKLKTALGIPSEDPTENLTWYNEEMEECASGYATYVLELLAEAKKVTTDPIVLIEQRLDYSKYVESGFGTGDCVLIADGTLNIVDYKHGKGVEVSADHNPQMMLYALGALEIFDALYDIDTVTMTIYQPRRSNVSTYTVSTAELLEWAETVLKPTAALAFSGEGEFHCGEWCQFCKAKADCRERAKANLALAAYDFAEPPLLTDEEVEEVLAKVDDLVSWANDIKEYALQAAISGKAWNGWKVVEGRSNRKYTDERLVAAAVIAAGHDPYEQKLLGISRFARNTVTLLETVRELKSLGIDVFFEEQNIYTMSAEGEVNCCLRSCPRWHRKKQGRFQRIPHGVEESPSRTERSASAIPISSVTTRVPMESLLSMRSRRKSCGEFIRSSSPEKLRAALQKG